MRKYIAIFLFNLKAQMNFKVDYLFSIFSFAIHVFIFNELWDFILKGKVILGYSRSDLIWYIIIGELIMYLMPGKEYKKIADMIKNGDVANMLIKPINFFKYVIAEEMGCIINLIINFMAAIVMGIAIVGVPSLTFGQSIFFLVALVLSTCLLILVHALMGMLAFFTEENEAYFMVLSKAMLLLVFTPIEFFPNSIQKILFVVPTTYIVYPPSKIWIHFDMTLALKLVLFQLIFLILIFITVKILSQKGVKKINVNGG